MWKKLNVAHMSQKVIYHLHDKTAATSSEKLKDKLAETYENWLIAMDHEG